MRLIKLKTKILQLKKYKFKTMKPKNIKIYEVLKFGSKDPQVLYNILSFQIWFLNHYSFWYLLSWLNFKLNNLLETKKTYHYPVCFFYNKKPQLIVVIYLPYHLTNIAVET